jgi:hypothetical protein
MSSGDRWSFSVSLGEIPVFTLKRVARHGDAEGKIRRKAAIRQSVGECWWTRSSKYPFD